MRRQPPAETLRLAEIIAAISLATDLGMGQPLEQALRTCLIALALGERLKLSAAELGEVYYVALLRFLGCSADSHEWAAMVGGDDIAVRAAIAPVLGGRPNEFAGRVIPAVGRRSSPLQRARLVAGMMTAGKSRARDGLVAHCELAENLAQRLGLSAAVRAGLGAAFEQWNGAGLPKGLRGEAIPLSARIVFVARDLEIIQREAGPSVAAEAARARRGRAYDPALADAFLAAPAQVLGAPDVPSVWDEVLSHEPEPRPWIPESRLDEVLSVFADFADLKAPFTAGHSREVARLAAAAAGGEESVKLRRAALLHDLGRSSVPNGIWEKPGPLSDGEWERVRLHSYYSERIAGRVKALRTLAPLAGMHHERLDGSGYHRGCARAEIPKAARLLAAADAYQAMTQHRAHRPAHPPEKAAAELERMAKAELLDAQAVHSVLSAAGHSPSKTRAHWPAGLSEREVDVLRLICRGDTKKQVAQALFISASTVDHHVRHIYDKAGVQTRAGATLFALEHDLLK